MFAVGVVHQHHRERKLAGRIHGLEPQDAGGGLLAAADHVRKQLRELLVQGGHQVSAVVDDDIRADFQHPADVLEVFLLRTAVDGKDVQAFVHQRGGDVVLRAQGVGARDVHIGPTGCQHLAQMGGLGLQMHAQGHLEALERLRPLEILLDSVQQGHVAAHPAQFELPAFPQVDIFDVTCHVS